MKILKDVRVIEMGTYITGPAAGMHLADLGADVIKVEKPDNNWFPGLLGKREPQRIVIAQGARVDGPLVFEREVKLYVHATAQIGPVTGATAVRFEGDRAPQD